MPKLFPGEVFANTADFDTGIRQLIPRYDEMLEVITRCLPSTTCRILELGCGTGELSLKMLKRFPKAKVIALDYSPRMLQFAQDKIKAAGYEQRWTGIEADFGEWANNPEKFGLGSEFDAAVSSLAIHHLDDEMKFKLFQQVADSLCHGSCFWNADPVLPELPAIAEVYEAAREEWATQQVTELTEILTKVGISDPQGYSSPDQLATLDTHMQMLSIAGFETIAIPWKHYGLAVFGGWV